MKAVGALAELESAGLIDEARDWMADCARNAEDAEWVEHEATAAEVARHVALYYQGGVSAFIRATSPFPVLWWDEDFLFREVEGGYEILWARFDGYPIGQVVAEADFNKGACERCLLGSAAEGVADDDGVSVFCLTRGLVARLGEAGPDIAEEDLIEGVMRLARRVNALGEAVIDFASDPLDGMPWFRWVEDELALTLAGLISWDGESFALSDAAILEVFASQGLMGGCAA